MPASPVPVRRPSGPTSPSTPVPNPLRRNQSTFGSSALPSPTRITPSHRSSAQSATGAEQRKARRQDLRDFYGLRKEDGVVGSPVAEEGVGRNPLDIDSTSFNASLYYDDLISKSSLSGLLKTASSLSADIGTLHSSRHALVYNHHHQLFEAGDTISHLNSRTPQLSSIVRNLQQSFSEISRLVDAVALPDAHDRVGLNNRTEGDGEVKRGMERLRLMILAEGMRPLHYHEKTLSGRDSGPPEEIRKCYEGLRDKLEKGAEEGNEGIKGLLEECRKLVEGLPAGAVAIGQPEGV